MWAILLTALVALQPAAPATSPAGAAYRQGVAAEAKNDLAAALAAYDQAIADEPSMAIAHDRLGFVLGRLGRTADAIGAFERAVALGSDALRRAVSSRRDTMVDEGPRRRASALEAAVRLRPAHAEARYYLALTMKQRGDLAGAIADLREAVRLGARARAGAHAARHRASGGRRCRRRDRASARGDRPSIRSSVDAQNSLGLALMQNGESARGDETFAALVASGAVERHGAAQPRHRADAERRPRFGRRNVRGGDRAASRAAPRRTTTSAWR